MDLHQKLITWVEKLNKLAKNRYLRIVIQVLIISLCAVYLYNNILSIKAAKTEFIVNIPLVALSFGITLAAVCIGGSGFYLVLKAFSFPIGYFEAMNIHIQSNLAKYIPGYGWQLVGKAYLTTQAGVPPGLVGLAMAVELFQLVYSGLYLAILSIPMVIVTRWQIGRSILPVVPVFRIIFSIIFFLFPLLIHLFSKQIKLINQSIRIKPMFLVYSSTTMLIGWAIFGYSYWLLGRALTSISMDQILLFVFTLTASLLIGLAIIIVPASIGVRESVMVWMLGPVVGTPQAVIIAALARVTVTISELVSAFAFKLIKKSRNNTKVLESKLNLDGHE